MCGNAAVAVNRVSARTNVICIELSTISLMSVCVYVRFGGVGRGLFFVVMVRRGVKRISAYSGLVCR